MAGSRFGRSALFGAVIVLTGAGAFGLATVSFGAATIGQTHKIDLTEKPQSGIDALKAQYKRPSTIPFPRDNPYTPEKAALGKKLYFDTRLSLTSG
jgi:cytochrome c peroxidase